MMMGREPRQRDVEPARRRQRPAGAELRGHRQLVVQRPPPRRQRAGHGGRRQRRRACRSRRCGRRRRPPTACSSSRATPATRRACSSSTYPDYRGGTVSWRARVENHSAVSWRTAPSGHRRAGGLRVHGVDVRRGGRLRARHRRPSDADLPEPPRSRGAQLETATARPWCTSPRAAPPAAPASTCSRCRRSRSPRRAARVARHRQRRRSARRGS